MLAVGEFAYNRYWARPHRHARCAVGIITDTVVTFAAVRSPRAPRNYIDAKRCHNMPDDGRKNNWISVHKSVA